MSTVKIDPNLTWEALMTCVAREQEQTATAARRPSVQEVAERLNLKVGDKDVRVIGHGSIPAPDHQVRQRGWILMRTADYKGIVPQEVIDTARIYLDEGADITAFLIADDLRSHRLREFRRIASSLPERVRAVEWQKVGSDTIRRASAIGAAVTSAAVWFSSRVQDRAKRIDWGRARKVLRERLSPTLMRAWQDARTVTMQRGSALASGASAAISPIFDRAKQRAEEINWARTRSVLGKILLGVAIATFGIALAAVILPLLALVAIPAGLLAYDPWFIAVDSEGRYWVIAEWYD
jgi:hypothetical protein